MKAFADHGRTTGVRRLVAGLAVALFFLGCGTTVSAGKPRGADPKLQPEAGGFLLTENVRVSAEARADYGSRSPRRHPRPPRHMWIWVLPTASWAISTTRWRV